MFAVLSIIFGAFPVFADTTIYSQSTADTYTAVPGGFAIIQQLGTGLTGVVTAYSFKYSVVSTATSSLGMAIYECPTNPTTSLASCTAVLAPYYAIPEDSHTIGTYQYFSSPGEFTPFSFNPTKYYALAFWHVTNNAFRIGGSTSNNYTNGICSAITFPSSGGTCGSAVDLAFGIIGVQTSLDASYTYNLQPSNASTTASTQVSIGFDYHASVIDSITSYAILLTDITQDSSSFTITGTASSGDGSVSRVLTLTSGHTYNYVAYICSSGGTCYGGQIVTFSVVASGFNVGSTLPNPLSTPYSSTSTIYQNLPLPNVTDVNDSNATSSLSETTHGWSNIPAYFAQRVPWGYLFDIAAVYNSAATSTEEFGAIAINFDSLDISSTTKSYLPARVVLLSTTTATYYLGTTTLNIFNTLVVAVGWVSLMGYWFKRGIAV